MRIVFFRCLRILCVVSACGTAAASPCGDGSSGRVIVVAKTRGDFSSVQEGLQAAGPGDTVLVREGTYPGDLSFPRSGSANMGCIVLRGEAGAVIRGGQVGIEIIDKSYIAVVGLTFADIRKGEMPTGINVIGSAHHIEIRENLVHHVESKSDAHGIAFYGSSSTPMTDILVSGNEIRDCKLGFSEALVLNGNITRFEVSRNRVHDNDNIGIDFIGFEGIGPKGQDQARNGACIDNIVYNISSANNPAYSGDRAADGIYVDGGRDIVIERNRIWNSDIGIELASEHKGNSTENIVVRNNLVAGSYAANITIGGFAANKGNARNISVWGNTTYQAKGSELVVQYNARKVSIKNNIFYSRGNRPYLLNEGMNNSEILVENNLYFGNKVSNPGDFPDPRALFSDPRLAAAPSDFRLTAGSPAIDAGINLGLDSSGMPAEGSFDASSSARVKGARLDLGAHEF